MGVLIDNRQDIFAMSLKRLEKTAQAILNALDLHKAELSILILDDPQIAVINQDYLNRKGPTNVIAFPMHDSNTDFKTIDPLLLGDVVISVETARREGEAAGISTDTRFTQLLIHGILHLIGYDHEKNNAEAIRMEEKSNDLLGILAS